MAQDLGLSGETLRAAGEIAEHEAEEAGASTTVGPSADVPIENVHIVDVSVTDVAVTDVPATDVPVTDIPVTDIPVTDIRKGLSLAACRLS
eukprot:1255357-Pleurochrysis_carterae.AAC.1